MKLLSFTDKFYEAKTKTITFTFGRFQPPTIGHEKLFDKVKKVAGRNPFRIYSSHSEDKKNPLDYKTKIRMLRKMFPKYKRNIMGGAARTALEIASNLYDEGFTHLQFVVGSDRVDNFNTLLNKYNGNQMRDGYYNFQDIKVVSAGERDPDAEGVSGMSASKMRAAASAGDFEAFKSGLPSGFRDAKKLYDILRNKMGIKEMLSFKDWSNYENDYLNDYIMFIYG